MTDSGRILLTGITGSAGSWLAREALDRGCSVLALVRADSQSKAEERAFEALEIIGGSHLGEKLDVVRGDVCRKGLIANADRSIFEDVSMVIHCAGAINFRQAAAEHTHRVNVEGTANVLKLTGSLGVPYGHVSTAYIAGKRQGLVLESEDSVGQSFNNAYEQTKCEAEVIIRKWGRKSRLPVHILRPSILLGDSKEGKIVNFDATYNMMRFFDGISGLVSNQRIRAVVNPNSTKNFVPIDYFAKAALHILEHARPATYHITNPNPLKISELRDIFASLFNMHGITIVDENDFARERPTRIELLYKKAMPQYRPYMQSEPLFDRTNTDAALAGSGLVLPEIDEDFFAMLLDYARACGWGRRRRRKGICSSKSVQAARKYFDEILTKHVDQPLLPNLKNLSATCRVVLREHEHLHWSLEIVKGILTTVSQNGMDCQCSLITDADTFCEVAAGKLAPHKAFFTQRAHITGDMKTGLKLTTALATFFRKFPYQLDV